MAHIQNHLGHVVGGHDVLAIFVDRAPLVVHDVVELQQILADLEIARLDLLLRLLKRLVDPGMNDRLTVLQAELLQHAVEPVGREDAHQIVFQRQVEFRQARIALTAGPAAKLVVDTPAFVPLGSDHAQPASLQDDLPVRRDLVLDLLDLRRPFRLVLDLRGLGRDPHFEIAAELDVGAAAGHVGGDGHGAGPAGLGDDMRLLLVEPGIEHVVRHLVLFQRRRQHLRFFDRHRADQHRLLALMAILDLLDNGHGLLVGRPVDLVVLVDTGQRHVSRNRDDFQPVDLGELRRLGHRRAGHAGQLGVQAEIILEGDRRQGLGLLLDVGAFLGLHGLMQAFGQPAAFHHAAGELVDQHHPVVLDDVVPIALEQLVRPERLIGVMHQIDVADVVQPAFVQQPGLRQQYLDLLLALLGHGDGARLLVDLVVVVAELRNQPVDLDVQLGGILCRAGDDQRRACFVDQDAVDLVDDGEVEVALHHVVDAGLHVVA